MTITAKYSDESGDTLSVVADGVVWTSVSLAAGGEISIALHSWIEAGGVPDAYTPDQPAVPQSISDRQFFQQLAVDGIITEDQALASNAAVIPAPLFDIINQLPAEKRFDAKMKVSGATTFLRDDPLTIAIGQAYGMTPADIDVFFTAAAAL